MENIIPIQDILLLLLALSLSRSMIREVLDWIYEYIIRLEANENPIMSCPMVLGEFIMTWYDMVGWHRARQERQDTHT